mmetsp:Transcript_23008/g.74982  ORF Transcript_23008/g.74982 Transcript_23008/m.74982 type:complete len:553 (-) Transcript_23008:45-1703(-)
MGKKGSADGASDGAKAAETKHAERISKELAVRAGRFKRGDRVRTKALKDRKLKGQLERTEGELERVTATAAKVERWLLPSEAGVLEAEGMERTWRFSQQEVAEATDVASSRRAFDLELPELGPYKLAFTRNGKHLLLGGWKGHLASFDWQRARLATELQVREELRAVTYLHSDEFFAAAQRKYCYIYDRRGIEIHCLKEHTEVTHLTFLPHHFLLVSASKSGMLRYQDTTHGAMVAQHRTRQGARIEALCQNPHNAVVCLGHGNGTVSMWSPNQGSALVSLFCHRGPVRALAIDREGRHLVTAGADAQVRCYDVRTYKELHSYFSRTPASALAVSQRGLLAVGHGPHVQVWGAEALAAKAAAPYMTHTLPNAARVSELAFCPYEDVLGVGHSLGASTMLVPGAGEPNFDTFVANPFETRTGKREAEVRQLLDKLAPEMIQLDPEAVGGVRRTPNAVLEERREQALEAELAARKAKREEGERKKKMKGKNKPSKRLRKKLQNVVDDQTLRAQAEREKQRGAGADADHHPDHHDQTGDPLDRLFANKRSLPLGI